MFHSLASLTWDTEYDQPKFTVCDWSARTTDIVPIKLAYQVHPLHNSFDHLWFPSRKYLNTILHNLDLTFTKGPSSVYVDFPVNTQKAAFRVERGHEDLLEFT